MDPFCRGDRGARRLPPHDIPDEPRSIAWHPGGRLVRPRPGLGVSQGATRLRASHAPEASDRRFALLGSRDGKGQRVQSGGEVPGDALSGSIQIAPTGSSAAQSRACCSGDNRPSRYCPRRHELRQGSARDSRPANNRSEGVTQRQGSSPLGSLVLRVRLLTRQFPAITASSAGRHASPARLAQWRIARRVPGGGSEWVGAGAVAPYRLSLGAPDSEPAGPAGFRQCPGHHISHRRAPASPLGAGFFNPGNAIWRNSARQSPGC